MPRIPRNDSLVNLANHPGWADLTRLVRARMVKEFRQMTRDLMGGRTPDPVEAAYKRGFYAGLKFLLDQPPRSRRDLEKALEERK